MPSDEFNSRIERPLTKVTRGEKFLNSEMEKADMARRLFYEQPRPLFAKLEYCPGDRFCCFAISCRFPPQHAFGSACDRIIFASRIGDCSGQFSGLQRESTIRQEVVAQANVNPG